MEKASKVNQLIMKKDQSITQLEVKLAKGQQNISQLE